jgi:hypothetical protein
MGMMTASKKGIFFTGIALMMLSLVFLIFSPKDPLVLAEEISAIKAKAEIVDQQADTISKSYIPDSVQFASYNAFYALAEYMNQRDRYFDNSDIFNKTFKEVMIRGTMCCSLVIGDPDIAPICDDTDNSDGGDVDNLARHTGIDKCIGMDVMKDKNLTVRLDQIENLSTVALRVDTIIDRVYDEMKVVLYQDNTTGPFRVGVNVTINYSVSAGNLMINDTQNITAIFDIDGIQDPLYFIESPGVAKDGGVKYVNYFNRTNQTNNSAWGVANMYQLAEWRLYKHYRLGSSFLNRFYGIDDPSDCCGVESLINPVAMSSVDGDWERPYIDWCYYGSNDRCSPSTTGAMWNVTCVTTEVDGTLLYNFAIDTYHAVEYNLTNNLGNYLYTLGPPPACDLEPDFPSVESP